MEALGWGSGVQEATQSAFVLVAGGLGERLGYSGIKVALPTDLARGACFLQVPPLPSALPPEGEPQAKREKGATAHVAENCILDPWVTSVQTQGLPSAGASRSPDAGASRHFFLFSPVEAEVTWLLALIHGQLCRDRDSTGFRNPVSS